MQTIRDGNGVIGYATHDGGVLVGALVALEEDHPRRRFAVAMLRYGNAVVAGEIDEAYRDDRAALFARTLLMPDGDFDALHLERDYVLAECFNVPLDQVALKRNDLVTWWDRPRSEWVGSEL
jgi:hypothetical protein